MLEEWWIPNALYWQVPPDSGPENGAKCCKPSQMVAGGRYELYSNCPLQIQGAEVNTLRSNVYHDITVV